MDLGQVLGRKKREAELLDQHETRAYSVLYLGLILRMAGIFLVSETGIYLLNMIIALGWMAGLILTPVALYYDRKYVSRELDWVPSRIYILLGLVPLLGLVTTAYYMKKRRNLAVKKGSK